MVLLPCGFIWNIDKIFHIIFSNIKKIIPLLQSVKRNFILQEERIKDIKSKDHWPFPRLYRLEKNFPNENFKNRLIVNILVNLGDDSTWALTSNKDGFDLFNAHFTDSWGPLKVCSYLVIVLTNLGKCKS